MIAISALQAAQAQTPQQGADLGCVTGPNAAAWEKVKQRFKVFLENTSRPFELASRESVKTTLEGSIDDVKAVGGFGPKTAGECGLGRMMIQLLNIMVVDEPSTVVRVIREAEVLASPVMTLILDVPWIDTALSGWPFFGVLAQVALHKTKILRGADYDSINGVDGITDDATRAYFDVLVKATETSDVAAMVVSSVKFMEIPNTQSTFGLLTAVAAQTAAQEKVEERLGFMNGLQTQFRNVIHSASDLEAALSIRWPLWGLLHISVDAFSTVGATAR